MLLRIAPVKGTAKWSSYMASIKIILLSPLISLTSPFQQALSRFHQRMWKFDLTKVVLMLHYHHLLLPRIALIFVTWQCKSLLEGNKLAESIVKTYVPFFLHEHWPKM
ncbi:PREDICTED: uncharacterized protein LOC109342245 [Lupinus angustifolius]|uniref:uncharacterized protein LOC109342245 n=1 Tax=Lupinus angustifolius TaxID=3871 RepID=UPI00092E3CDF|nr:PREDICTED: uncharacterized protein LOC109342245 [Lupinus angustifolius]